MTDDKRNSGRPRKWSSDAERMRAARAAKRSKKLAEEQRRAAENANDQTAQLQRRTVEPDSAASSTEVPAVKSGNTGMAIHATCEATILELRAEVRKLEDEYDDSVYDRWILEHRYRMAIARMREHDPDGVEWLDVEVLRWEARREGYLEQRRRLRRSSRRWQ